MKHAAGRYQFDLIVVESEPVCKDIAYHGNVHRMRVCEVIEVTHVMKHIENAVSTGLGT